MTEVFFLLFSFSLPGLLFCFLGTFFSAQAGVYNHHYFLEGGVKNMLKKRIILLSFHLSSSC